MVHIIPMGNNMPRAITTATGGTMRHTISNTMATQVNQRMADSHSTPTQPELTARINTEAVNQLHIITAVVITGRMQVTPMAQATTAEAARARN